MTRPNLLFCFFAIVMALCLIPALACGSLGEKEPSPTEPVEWLAPTKVPPLLTPTDSPKLVPTSQSKPTARPRPTEPPKPAVDQPPVVAVGSPDPGLACFGTFGFGLTCLDDNGWQSYTKDRNQVGSDQIQDMTICPSGRVLVVHTLGISGFDGKKWTQYKLSGYVSPSGIACDDQNNFWVAHYKGVSYFDGKAWKTHTADNLGSGESASELVDDVAIAPDGIVWVAAANSVARFDGKEWEHFQEGQGLEKKYYFSKIIVDGNGNPWAAHSMGVVTYDGERWTNYANTDLISVNDMLADSEGRIWLATTRGVVVFEDGGWTTYGAEAGLSSEKAKSLALDGQGRLWVGTVWGLNVFDGREWTQYFMHTSDLAANEVVSIVAQDGGPQLPELLKKDTGSITGQVKKDDQPIANSKVEVCVERIGYSFSGPTPCSDQPFFESTTTDAEGFFTLQDLPVGQYILVIQSGGGKWAQLKTQYGTTEFVPVAEGEETDLGLLTVTEKK